MIRFFRSHFQTILLFLAAFFAFPVRADANDPATFPFILPLEKSPDTVIDASSWLDAPAGARGFVAARDGHFYAGEQRIRFWGTNLAFGGNFPDKETAPLLADKLARFGVNIVRIHSADVIDGRPSLIDRATTDTQHLHAANLDRLDFLVAELKRRGIYVNFNLHVNRTFTDADGVAEAAALPPYSKNVTLFDARMIELQKKFARDLLTHVNPYTGAAYVEEPALAFIEITNENSAFYGGYSGRFEKLPPAYAAQLDSRFFAWLRDKYADDAAIIAAWGVLPEGESLDGGRVSRPVFKDTTRSDACRRDYFEFLWEIERSYFRDMRDYLKDTLHARVPITGTMYFTMAGGMIQADLMDFVDMHAYWQHPEFPAEWKGKWTIKNTPMVDQPAGNALTWLAAARVEGKPFTVSEYNEPWPNFYDAEGLPLAAAYAARQDWDAVYVFNFNGNGEFRRDKVVSFFDIDGHPVKTAQMIAAAAIFTRGDLGPAIHQRTATVSRGTAIDSALRFDWAKGEDALAALGWSNTNTVDFKWSLRFLPEERNAVARLDESTPSTTTPSPFQWGSGLATLNTARSKFVIGHPNGQTIELGGSLIELPPSSTNFAAVTLTSLDADARDVLLIAAGRTENTGMKWDADFQSASFGTAPVLTEGVSARLSLAIGSSRVYALDESGAIREELPARYEANSLQFEIGPQYRTIWYLIRRE